ncbi:MAG: hydroxyacid dehydrogenase [Sphingobium sp.]|nr:MAG: hydroxyacid dehydrogenase [Sphingobium sp.]
MSDAARPTVVALGTLHPRLASGIADRFHVLHAENDPATITPEMRAARAIVTHGGVGASAAVMDALPALEMIGLMAVGYDAVDVAHAREKGIGVSNTPDVLTDDVADLAVGLIYAVIRRIAVNDRFVREGRWAAGGTVPFCGRVTGSRIGILGLGRIGQAIAGRLAPVAGEILYHSRRARPESPFTFVPDIIAFAHACDIMVVATSGGPEAHGLVDTGVIEALGPNGTLINISRGGVIDESALVAALVDGRLGGAGLDVFAHEPHVPEALLGLDNVVLQPHQGSATVNTRNAMADLVLANLDAHFAGQPLPTPVA